MKTGKQTTFSSYKAGFSDTLKRFLKAANVSPLHPAHKFRTYLASSAAPEMQRITGENDKAKALVRVVSDWENPETLRQEGYFPQGVDVRYTDYPCGDSYAPAGIYGRPRITLSTNGLGQVSRSAAAHEGGHHRDLSALKMPPEKILSYYGRNENGSNGPKLGDIPFSDLYHRQDGRKTPIDAEVAAWDKATGMYDPEYRKRALNTYYTQRRKEWAQDYLDSMRIGIKGMQREVPRGYRKPQEADLQRYKVPAGTVRRFMETHTPGQAIPLLDSIMRNAPGPYSYQTRQ